jgi:type I restriction enzyme S subunit
MSRNERSDLPSPPLDWERFLLRDKVLLGSGSTPLRSRPERYYINGVIPWVKTLDLNEGYIVSTDELITPVALRESSCHVLPTKAVLIAMYGGWLQIGRTAILGIPAATNQAICSLTTTDDSIDPNYLLRFMQAYRFRWKAIAGSTRKDPNITKEDVARFEIASPPILQQKKIARILTTVDNLIEKTESLIAKYQAIKQGMMHDLFTRGVDAHGHLRPPQTEAPDLYKQSELGWIPKEWDVVPLSTVASLGRGKFTPRPRNDPKFYGGSYPFIQTGDVANSIGHYLSSFSQTLNELGTTVSKGFGVGTIVVTIAANIADTAILAVPMYLPDSIVGVVVSLGGNVRFFELCLRRAKHFLDSRAPQSAQKNINLEDLRPLLVPFPILNEQERIAAVYEANDSAINAELLMLNKLKRQKTGLMQDLLTGKVRVTVDEFEEATAHA